VNNHETVYKRRRAILNDESLIDNVLPLVASIVAIRVSKGSLLAFLLYLEYNKKPRERF